MAYIIDADIGNTKEDFDNWQKAWKTYFSYLESLRERIPKSAFEFATAPWHYGNKDSRNLHDAWVNSLTIREPAQGARNEIRTLEIEVTLLGPYHDGITTLIYRDVKTYSLDTPAGCVHGGEKRLNYIAHGDWLVDEIRLSERGLVIHEVKFERGSRWLIECKDIECTWKPTSAPYSQTP